MFHWQKPMPSNSPPESFAEQRRRMVEEQLKRRGIADARVLAAMAAVPREAFVPSCYRQLAYEDRPLPIGFCQTISQPFTVAYMAQLLVLCGTENVLEIGTGSGYGAAVLSQLADRVHSVERIAELARTSQARLQRLGYSNAAVHLADGSRGLWREAPFDAIVVTAGADSVPADYTDQLAEGGRLVIPVGHTSADQRLYRLQRQAGQLEAKDFGSFAFVPLIREHPADEAGE